MSNITGIKIANCNFNSNVGFMAESFSLNGIVVSYGHTEINDCVFNNYTHGVMLACARGNITNSTFSQNIRGIDTYSWNSPYPISVLSNNVLNGNSIGIYCADPAIDITQNQIDLTGASLHWNDPNNGSYQCGIFNYYYANISENILKGNDGDPNITSFGIIQNSQGGDLTNISSNQFKDVDVGLSCQGDNSQLDVRCNEFGSNGQPHPITAWRVSSGELGNQGTCSGTTTGSPTINRWNYPTSACTSINNDFWIDGDDIPMVYYYTYVPSGGTDHRIIPNNVTCAEVGIDILPMSCDGQPESASGDCIIFEGLLDDDDDTPINNCNNIVIAFDNNVTEWLNKIDDLDIKISSITAQLDAGKTNDLIADINDPNISQTAIQEDLTSIEFLSRAVQIEAIDRFDPLSSNNLKEVLISQAPYEKEVLDELDTRIQPVATSAYNLIMEAHNTERLEHNLVSATREKEELERIIKAETVHAVLCHHRLGNDQEAVQLMEEANIPKLKEELVEHHLRNNNTQEAANVLNNTESLSDDYIDYMDIQIQLTIDDRSLFELSSTELETIQRIANEGNLKARVTGEAGMLLSRLGIKTYIPYVDPIGTTAAKRSFVPDELKNTNEFAKISPNPAHSFVGIQTTLDEAGIIEVYDIGGRLIQTINVEKGRINSEIEVENWIDGIYFYKINNLDGIPLQNGKFVVQH